MSLDLELDDAQRAIGDAVTAFCRDRWPVERARAEAGTLDTELWRSLAELGVLGLASPGGEGGALELVAALEPLGRAVFPGPLAENALAAQVLPGGERERIVSGAALVAAGTPPLLPWAPLAEIFLWVEGGRIWRARALSGVEPVETLGGEPWGRVELARDEELEGAPRALALHDLAVAAYGAAAAQRLVDDAAEHARTRRQFGRAIGEFQAVAHPLADCAMAAAAARALARAAAFHFDHGSDRAARAHAGAARLAATRAALAAAHTAHQVTGALGITLEGPVFHVSRRVRQLASLPDAWAREAVLEAFGLGQESAP